ncbi:hypothetical protein HQ531_03490 [bacterium]|nr:hypothetical protein [bacterium]
MITKPTVFILGAGASVPYGFPTGEGLREAIIKNGVDRYLVACGEDPWKAPESLGSYMKELIDVYVGSTGSIDLFLRRNDHFSDRGKQAITLAIMLAEKKDYELSLVYRKSNWLEYLIGRMLKDNLGSSEYLISKNNVSFIAFNYDRSLEYRLDRILRSSFSEVDPIKITNELKELNIYHCYGSISEFWDIHSVYGQDPLNKGLTDFWNNLKVVHEDRDGVATKSDSLDEAITWIEEAKQVFFLGFGYASENLKLLKLPRKFTPQQKVYGTAKGFSSVEISRIRYSLIYEDGSGYKSPYSVSIYDVENESLIRKYLLDS